MALQPGDRFGRYELVSWLGRGGMAETWRARLVGDAGVTKPVLIKKVLPEYANDEAFISMFISEARISASMSHGNVAQVFDFGRVDGEYFLAMEFVDGQPLNRLLKRALKSGLTALPIPLATFIALEMCRGLHYAHTRTDSQGAPLGLVHRDISPDNVLVSYEGQVKIVDFGIAKARSLRNFKTEPGVVKGKYLFFSPEQARGEEVDARTDVWATGVVLYELLCGQMPVMGPAHIVMMRMAQGDFPSPRQVRKELPAELDELVLRALSVDLEARYESSHAFADALAGFLYSFAPRFSSMNLAHLVRELFRGDLVQEGREMAVPPSFQEELQAWVGGPTERQPPAPPRTDREQAPSRVPPMKTRRLAPEPPSDAEEPEPSPRPAWSRWWAPGIGGLVVLGCAALVWLPGQPVPGGNNPSPLQPLQGAAERKAPDAQALAVAPQPIRPGAPEPTAQAGDAGPPAQAEEVQWLIGSARKVVRSSPTRALELTARCLELSPHQPECQELTESARARLRELDEAHKQAEHAPEVVEPPAVDPREFEILVALAKKAVQARRYTQAVELSERCLQQIPDYLDCLLYSGSALAATGHTNLAAERYRRFLEVAPPNHPKYKPVKMLVDDYVGRSPSRSR